MTGNSEVRVVSNIGDASYLADEVVYLLYLGIIEATLVVVYGLLVRGRTLKPKPCKSTRVGRTKLYIYGIEWSGFQHLADVRI